MSRRLQIAALAIILFALSGCATSNITAVEAKQFASLSLVDFLKVRFQDRQSFAVKNTVRYLAYFNDVNFRQLERPTFELWAYCDAGNGKMDNLKPFAGDPVGRFFSTPIEAAIQGSLYAQSVGRSGLALGTAAHAVLLNEQINAYYGAADARKAYSTMRDKGVYGIWECTYEGTDRKPWRASVLPIGYAPPSDPGNLLTNHRMVLEITPLR